MSANETIITRRQAIRGAASIVGGTIAAAHVSAFLGRAAIAATDNAQPAFFTDDQFRLVTNVVDVMIPETDTPGAITAGVHHFIDLMLDEWASPERQDRFRSGIDELGSRLGGDFSDADPDERLERLRVIDQEAHDDGAEDDFFREFKRLALFGYYSSEAGATSELQYEALTPDYKACVPLDDIGRAWFWMGFRHGL